VKRWQAIAAGVVAGTGIAVVAKRELGAHLVAGALVGGLFGWAAHAAGAAELWAELTSDEEPAPSSGAPDDGDDGDDDHGGFDA
jgi:hypothetical protein